MKSSTSAAIVSPHNNGWRPYSFALEQDVKPQWCYAPILDAIFYPRSIEPNSIVVDEIQRKYYYCVVLRSNRSNTVVHT